jgi:hypothetical protein
LLRLTACVGVRASAALHLLAEKDSSTADERGDSTIKYDVFLSHKQSDAKDFVRALHTLFTVRGFRAFLDMEYTGDLGSLEEIVAASKHVVFVLTDNALESKWCLLELEAAVKHGVEVCIVKKEGSRWLDPETGMRSLPFPSKEELSKVPEQCQSLFQIKIVDHSDTYYSSFIEKLLERLQLQSSVDGGATKTPPPVGRTTEELQEVVRGQMRSTEELEALVQRHSWLRCVQRSACCATSSRPARIARRRYSPSCARGSSCWAPSNPLLRRQCQLATPA